MTTRPAWEGAKPFRIEKKIDEAVDTASLWLVSEDGRRPPPFSPGQFLTLEIELERRTFVRCYSISSAPGEHGYRITVKAETKRAGEPSASTWLARQAKVGERLRVRAPAGAFTLEPAGDSPAVLVAGGIGVTPFASMLAAHRRARSPRVFHVFLGMRSGDQAPLQRELALAAGDRVRLHVLYSRPRREDVLGRDYEREGRVTLGVLKELVPPDDRPYDFFLCGPPEMLRDVAGGLEQAGVPASKVHVEVFGPTAVREVARATRRLASGATVEVEFARSRKRAMWSPGIGALIDLAEREGVPIPYACRAGRCGTCLTALRAGEVEYPVTPGFGALGPGYCLPCIARPKTKVVLDA